MEDKINKSIELNTASDCNTSAIPPESATKKESVRFHLIDALRAITMLSMICYHFCFDYFVIFGNDPFFTGHTASIIWQHSICCSFIIISGFVFPFGRRKILRRGLIVNFFGLIVSAVTLIFIPEEQIWFGILNLIGCSMLITYLYDRFLISKLKYNTANHVRALIFWLILFILTKYIPNGYVGIRNRPFVMLPDSLYKNAFLIPFGFPTPDFVSGDYFPIIPWLFLYFCGYHLNEILISNNRFLDLAKKRIPMLSSLGKHSLLIYLIHQPICYAIAILLCQFR